MAQMKIVAGIHLPDDDGHFSGILASSRLYDGKGTYQLSKIEAGLAVTTQFRHAVCVGAHVGLWARVLAGHFGRVTAMEPLPEYIECFKANLADRRHVTLLPIAIGAAEGTATMAVAEDGKGSASLVREGEITVQVRRLDDLDLGPVDFLRVSCEGAELPVIQGGERTIREHRPVVLIEQKTKRVGNHGFPREGAVRLLESWGAGMRARLAGDYLIAWPELP